MSMQVLTSAEYLAMQGITNFPEAVLQRGAGGSASSSSAAGELQVAGPVGAAISRAELISMMGNGMHAAAIGSVLLYALGVHRVA